MVGQRVDLEVPAPGVCARDAEGALLPRAAERHALPDGFQRHGLLVAAWRDGAADSGRRHVPAPARAAGGVANVHEAEGDADEVEDAAERPSFRCRIVDFLGAFTLAKQLESSSKKALKAQDAKANVTILPPSEYASRFLSAMDSYFIGTPSHPRLDARYGFDRMCDDTARAAESEGSGASAVRQPRLASVL